jgi:hypothetical protein
MKLLFTYVYVLVCPNAGFYYLFNFVSFDLPRK